MVTTLGAIARNDESIDLYPREGIVKTIEPTRPKATHPATVPFSVHPPKMTAAMAMNPRPPISESSNRPARANRKPSPL